MSVLNLKNLSFFYSTDASKQVKFFNNILFGGQIASLGVLSNWLNFNIKKINLAVGFLNNYSLYSKDFKFLNTLNILNFRFLVILLTQLLLFSNGLNLYPTFTILPYLQSFYFFPYLNYKFLSFSYNANLLSWFDLNKQLFRSNFLTITFKTTKRNIFLIISSALGSILWKKSSGGVGFSGKHKKSPEALRKLVDSLLLFLRGCNVHGSFIFRFLFVKSLDKNKLDALNSLLNRAELFYTYIIYDVRHPHGYMRLRKQRRL